MSQRTCSCVNFESSISQTLWFQPKKWWKLSTDKWNTPFLSGKEVGVSEWATVPCSVRIAGEGQPQVAASQQEPAEKQTPSVGCWPQTPTLVGLVKGLPPTTGAKKLPGVMTRRLYVSCSVETGVIPFCECSVKGSTRLQFFFGTWCPRKMQLLYIIVQLFGYLDTDVVASRIF